MDLTEHENVLRPKASPYHEPLKDSQTFGKEPMVYRVTDGTRFLCSRIIYDVDNIWTIKRGETVNNEENVLKIS
jgi:hypothetical protein